LICIVFVIQPVRTAKLIKEKHQLSLITFKKRQLILVEMSHLPSINDSTTEFLSVLLEDTNQLNKAYLKNNQAKPKSIFWWFKIKLFQLQSHTNFQSAPVKHLKSFRGTIIFKCIRFYSRLAKKWLHRPPFQLLYCILRASIEEADITLGQAVGYGIYLIY
jgi:hypothetical protein